MSLVTKLVYKAKFLISEPDSLIVSTDPVSTDPVTTDPVIASCKQAASYKIASLIDFSCKIVSWKLTSIHTDFVVLYTKWWDPAYVSNIPAKVSKEQLPWVQL